MAIRGRREGHRRIHHAATVWRLLEMRRPHRRRHLLLLRRPPRLRPAARRHATVRTGDAASHVPPSRRRGRLRGLHAPLDGCKRLADTRHKCGASETSRPAGSRVLSCLRARGSHTRDGWRGSEWRRRRCGRLRSRMEYKDTLCQHAATELSRRSTHRGKDGGPGAAQALQACLLLRRGGFSHAEVDVAGVALEQLRVWLTQVLCNAI